MNVSVIVIYKTPVVNSDTTGDCERFEEIIQKEKNLA
jgi:hypothetical protein